MFQLNENDLRSVVSSVVEKLITEEMHIIDEKLFPLASFIYDEIDKNIRNGQNDIEFTIPIEEVTKYYPYNNPQELKVVCGLGISNGKMEYKNGSLLVNIEHFYVEGKTRVISRIVHEITHFINDNEGGIKQVFATNDPNITKLRYYLRDTECNARCSEFGYVLKNENHKKPIEEYEKITRFKRIELLMNVCKNSISPKELKVFEKNYSKYKKRIYTIYTKF